MGVFRPIRWEVTGKSRIAPDGVCAWMEGGEVVVATETWGAGELETAFNGQTARCEASGCVTQRFSAAGVELWRVGAPRLYEIVSRFGGCETKTVTGFRDESQKVFVNGVNDWYGGEDDPAAQAQRVLELGFNAYRDGHEPQDLRLARLWAENGVLWWPQFSTHVWFDTPAFRRNFKEMLARWVKERRNNPAVVLWGLQNESSLPKEFAEDCTALIHSLDPRGRKVTTCNYGEGKVGDRPRETRVLQGFPRFQPSERHRDRVAAPRTTVSEWAIKIGTVARQKCRGWLRGGDCSPCLISYSFVGIL